MNENNITLNCIVKGVKFIGSFSDSFLKGQEKTNNTRLYTMCEINVPFETFTVDNVNVSKKNKVSMGDLFIVSPKIYHLYTNDDTRVNNYTFRLEFAIDKKTPESVEFLKEIERKFYSKDIKFYYMPWAYELCRNISIELNNGDFLGVSVARNKFEEFILRLLREIVNDKEDNKIITTKVYSDVSIRNEKIDHFFNVNYLIPNITIYDLAGDLNLSVRQVNRILKEEYNTSFHKKLIGIRLMHGKKNLLRTERTMEEIAEKIGFSSPSGFYVAFKKEFGITPSEFKKQNKLQLKD